ncbi:MAG: spore maturation protein, partial [Myxococcales bacterium]|nr:spore maturation protein [Myxococcales bacterium]
MADLLRGRRGAAEMLNAVFLLLVVGSLVSAFAMGTTQGLERGVVEGAKDAVDIAIGLLAQMTLWLGLMRILEEARLMTGLARLLAPLLRRLFPGLPRSSALGR